MLLVLLLAWKLVMLFGLRYLDSEAMILPKGFASIIVTGISYIEYITPDTAAVIVGGNYLAWARSSARS